MCYFCPKVSDEIGILLHTIEIHDACSTFSMRKSVFDEKIGCNAYRSHFPVRISEIKSYHEKGFLYSTLTPKLLAKHLKENTMMLIKIIH
jgi:hypothetical protein